ncbi:MAG TPA: hypothetical protein VNG89_06055 [Vicinamibacterales bacterium]|nr:hypothetical protein [Vicinamibacterales bacterium]
MRRTRLTGRAGYALGLVALFLIGAISAVAELRESLRRLLDPTASHNPHPAAVERREFR